MPTLIYLDNAATTPPDPEILAGMMERELSSFGNPSSKHTIGRAASRLLGSSRERLATLLDGNPSELILTGGGTESNGMACIGAAGETPARIAISAVEHPSITEAAVWLAHHRGWQVDLIPVDDTGRIQPETLREKIGPDTRIVGMMLANNELGTINDMAALAQVVREVSPRAKVIVDAVQAFAKMPFSVRTLGADCVSIAAHKLHGPKGIGALWTRTALQPVFKGGGQEAGIRGGTQCAALTWAFAEASERQVASMTHVTQLRNRLWENIQARIPDVILNGAPMGEGRLGNNINICIPGIPSEPLVNALSGVDVCVSSGSACGKGKFSKTLEAIGRRDNDGAFLRLSPGRFNTEDEMDAAAEKLMSAIQDLRSVYG
jgi:cysteine desulfurase